MKILVQKYGGTSVASDTNREKVVEKIKYKVNEGYKVVVVVSAIGRRGNPYSTDTLLSLVDTKCIKSRELDLLLSCGEIISSVKLSDTLNKVGISNHVLTGLQAGIETDNSFGEANILGVYPNKIRSILKGIDVIVVAGFQGGTNDGEVTTLGRGGSDTSAVVLGEALNCECVEIYTDVDGVMTADPRIVPEAVVIKEITYDELFQLAEDGAKVIHPKAVEVAKRANIIIYIKNTLNNSTGTTVTLRCGNFSKEKKTKNENVVTSITYRKNRNQIIINENKDKVSIHTIMKDIAIHKISIDLINFSMNKIVFTVSKDDYTKVKKILDKYNLLYQKIDECCKLSLIGNRIKGTPGVMFRIINSLYKENIDILQTSDSHTTIWCLIYEKDLFKALKELHNEFNLGEKVD